MVEIRLGKACKRRIITSLSRALLNGLYGEKTDIEKARITLIPAEKTHNVQVEAKSFTDDDYMLGDVNIHKFGHIDTYPFSNNSMPQFATLRNHAIRRNYTIKDKYIAEITRHNNTTRLDSSLIRSLPTMLVHCTNHFIDNPEITAILLSLSYDRDNGNQLHISKRLTNGQWEVVCEIDYVTLHTVMEGEDPEGGMKKPYLKDYVPLKQGSTPKQIYEWLGSYPWRDMIELTIRKEACILNQ